jgi:hypothetical protein
MADLDPPIVIRESRWKAALLVLTSVLLVGGMILAISNPTSSSSQTAFGYFGIVFFGLGFLISLAQVIRPTTLTLDAHGFEVAQLFRTWRVRWEQASNFQIGYQSRGFTRYIAFDYVPDRLAWGGLNRSGRLPSYWTMSPPKLLDLMKQCKSRWGPGAPASEPLSFGADDPAPRMPGPSKPPAAPTREPTVT